MEGNKILEGEHPFKTIKETSLTCHHVVSEPRDLTRYDYYVLSEYDNYSFVSTKNTFRYPQNVSKWIVKDTDFSVKSIRTSLEVQDELLKHNRAFDVNAFTLAECFRTIQELERIKNA